MPTLIYGNTKLCQNNFSFFIMYLSSFPQSQFPSLRGFHVFFCLTPVDRFDFLIFFLSTGERIFPPQAGLTYSTWYCVDKFSSALNDAHPVRLLTLVRNLQGREENLICLSVVLSSRERALFVSTQETPMPASGMS